jgi:branched-chain amino acid transport system permease protein
MGANTRTDRMLPSQFDDRLMAAIGLTLLAALIPFFVSEYVRTLIQRCLLWIPPIFGVYFIYSLLRQVHFAQSIFIGLGSYIVAFLAGKYFLTSELLILLPLSLLASVVVAYVLGIFIMRRTGFYFAIMGIAVTMVFWSLVYKMRQLTGGSDGISDIKNPTLLGVQLSEQGFYYICLLISLGLILLMHRILHSPFSMQLKAIRGDLQKAESIGIPVHQMRRLAFVVAGANAGLSGVLLAFLYNYVGPTSFAWEFGAQFVQAAIIGGVNYFVGPIVGAFAFVGLEFLVSTWFPNLWEIVIGVTVALIVVTVGEEGVTGIAKNVLVRAFKGINLKERTYSDGK